MKLPETKELQSIKPEMSSYTNKAVDLYISDAGTLALATDLFSELSRLEKRIKAQKEKVTKPLNEALKARREEFRPLEEQVRDVKQLLKTKMVSYHEEVEEKRKIEEERIERRVEKGTMREDTALRKLAEQEVVDGKVYGTGGGTATFSTERKVVVEDQLAVPIADYAYRPKVWEAIMVEVRKDVLGNKSAGVDPIDVPGIKVVETKNVVS